MASRWQRIRLALTPDEWIRAAALFVVVLALHVIGFGLLLIAIPHHFDLGQSGVFGFGLGITAYSLGLRHAFDADHIAAIDNTTRKLMGDAQRPLGVGFFFSLGHSSVVFLLALAFTIGIRGLGGAVSDDGSWLHSAERPDRADRLRLLPARDRAPEPDRPGRHRRDLPAPAGRRVQRGRARSASSAGAAS